MIRSASASRCRWWNRRSLLLSTLCSNATSAIATLGRNCGGSLISPSPILSRACERNGQLVYGVGEIR